MTRVLVIGAGGHMGRHVLRAVESTSGLSVASALDTASHPDIGTEVSPGIKLSGDLNESLQSAQVAIDFSTPEGTMALLEAAVPRVMPLVIATTGFGETDLARIEAAARETAVVHAANYSVGITMLLDLVAEAARKLDSYEIDVLEMHHDRKVDAPSGTALALANTAAKARGQDLVAVYHREGITGPREPGVIGMQTLRLGDSVGEHTVYLAGPGERLELTHRALSRENFASGAARAAHWVSTQPPGLYTMKDVLGDSS
ncbi:MAG: 4-hydroxy-tetrahydrodipicolinate reductase [bacterium]|nr:4-hydroxy-tetrahydrodipicolinate reductase [bacterium]